MPLKFRSHAWSQMCFIMSFSQVNRSITYASCSREIWHKVVIAVTAVFAHFVHAPTVDAHSRDRTFVNIWKQNATTEWHTWLVWGIVSTITFHGSATKIYAENFQSARLFPSPGAGSVSQKCLELFGPEKPFVKLQPAYSVKLFFSYVVKGIKIK